MRAPLLVAVVAALAMAPALAGCLFDRVGCRVYVFNGTGDNVEVEVTVRQPDGGRATHATRVVADNESALFGTVRGPEGTYAWTVRLGDEVLEGREALSSASPTLNVDLLPNGVEVHSSIA
jgi:hypothetical protein